MVRRSIEVVPHVELHLEDLPVDASGHVNWMQAFGAAKPLRVEIGVGNSPFLIEVCRRSPDFNYIGFEYCRRRVLKFAKKVANAEIANIRILRSEARNALEQFFAPATVDHFYVNHPDPWPKRRHAKHRFVQPHVVNRMTHLLVPSGGISLRTDAPAYAQQMLEVLDANETLENLAGPARFSSTPLEPFETPYEIKFRRQGLPIYYLEYRKR